MLQALAVIGEEFSLPVAQQALGKARADELNRSLAYLQRAEFIYEHPTVAQTEYTFKHALIHDVAYNSVLKERRTAIHARTAAAIETIYANRLDDHLNRLVHHYRLGGDGRKTVTISIRRVNKPMSDPRLTEAMVHFDAALETVSAWPRPRVTAELELALQISLGDSLMSTGGFAAEGVVKAFGRARELCGRVGDSSAIGSGAVWTLGFSQFWRQSRERRRNLARNYFQSPNGGKTRPPG